MSTPRRPTVCYCNRSQANNALELNLLEVNHFAYLLLIFRLQLFIHIGVKINDLAHLKARITEAINSVTPDMLGRVWDELEYRLDVCRATNGSHIELH